MPDAGRYVAEAIVVAYALMLIPRIRLAGLCGIVHRQFPFLFIGTYQGSSSGGGYHFVAVERQDSIFAESAAHSPLVAASECFCGVFKYRDAPFLCHFQNLGNLCGHSVEIDGDYGLWLFAGFLYSVGYRVVEQGGVHVPCVGLSVHKHRCGPDICHGIGRRAERETLHNHLIVATRSQRHKAEMNGCCA